MPKIPTNTTHREGLVKRIVWPFPTYNGKPTEPEWAPRIPKPESLPKHQAPPSEDALL